MAATQYPNLRRFLAASHRALPDRAIERVVASQGLEARAVEDFWDDLGNVAASALPAIGGAVGSVIAPGVGTAIGAGLGSVAGSALHSAIGPAPSAAPAAAAPAPVAYPSVAPAPQYGGLYPSPYPVAPSPPAASSQQAASQLMQLLMTPQMLQAIVQMMLGPAGNRTVPVPAAPSVPSAPATPSNAVPVSAFTNLLSALATQASEAYNAERALTPSPAPFTYGSSPWGSSVDLASPESRAEALMHLLHESGNREARAALGRRNRKRRLSEVVQALGMVTSSRAAAKQA
jgi:hypothetical protein